MRIQSDIPDLSDLSVVVTIWLPVVIYLPHLAIKATSFIFYRDYIDGENGATELLTLLFLGLAMMGAVQAIRIARTLDSKVLVGWLWLVFLGSFYFFGEEASWGQHVFGWDTPDGWAVKNDQAETNLHNLGGIPGSLLDKVPRNILTLCAFLLGFAYPLWRIKRSIVFSPSSWQYWLFPTTACVAAGFFAATGSLPGKMFDWKPAFKPDFGEIKELMIALFIMIYVFSILKRLRQAANETVSSNTTVNANP